jgi:RHS repeat-associated protein
MRTDTYYTSAANRFKTTWTYDGLGRVRVRKEYIWYDAYQWYPNGETRYIYDGMRVIQERNSGNTPTVAYTRGNDLSGSLEGAGGIGGLLARSHGYSGTTGAWSTHSFYHAAGGGNGTMLLNSSQASVATYRYDPFGRTLSQSGTLAAANVYRFSSKEQHAKSGMYYYGYRFYEPHLQRWVNRDPIFEGGRLILPVIGTATVFVSQRQHLYNFCDNSALMAVDPLGLYPFKPPTQDECIYDARKRRDNCKTRCTTLAVVGEAAVIGMHFVPPLALVSIGGHAVMFVLAKCCYNKCDRMHDAEVDYCRTHYDN